MKQALAVGLGLAAVLPLLQACEDEATIAAAARRPANCVSIVNAAALKAMTGTTIPGQMTVYGDPVLLSPDTLRVDVDAFDAQYAVEVVVDRDCKVLSVSINRETNAPT